MQEWQKAAVQLGDGFHDHRSARAGEDARGQKAIRYTLVSVVSVVVSQIVLASAYGLFHWTARSSSILACIIGGVPSYWLNRKWAWGKSGKSHLWREVMPFWTLAFIGLVFSTWAADFAGSYGTDHYESHLVRTGLVVFGSLAAFGILWIGKFVLFNKVMFVDRDPAS